MLAGLAALAMPFLAPIAAPAMAQNADLPAISTSVALSAMTEDDSATNAATSMGEARRQFLAALSNDKVDARLLAGMLPRAGQPVAALIGAAPAGQPRAEAVLARLGLDPQRFLNGRSAVGGPFISANDPQLHDLVATAARQAEMAATFARIPAFLPVASVRESSDFGYRADPFHGGGAFHAGIDMTGKTGEAIHAAADGVVVRAGWWAGYGKVVVVDHGNGMETRYGHLTRFHVKEGDVIRQGQVIGGMGSTGRSTGTHLHFEVRLDGRPLDPRPFVDLASFGLDAAPARIRQPVIVPMDVVADEPFAPLVRDDAVMAGGRSWQPRVGR